MQVYGQSRRHLGTENLGGKDWSWSLVLQNMVFLRSIPLSFVHFLIPVKFKSPVLDLSKILHKAQCLLCLLTITPARLPVLSVCSHAAVRGMYDRYPLGWPGGSPAPNLAAWITWLISMVSEDKPLISEPVLNRDFHEFPWNVANQHCTAG